MQGEKFAYLDIRGIAISGIDKSVVCGLKDRFYFACLGDEGARRGIFQDTDERVYMKIADWYIERGKWPQEFYFICRCPDFFFSFAQSARRDPAAYMSR